MDVVAEWQFALDAAAEALEANTHTFPPDELNARRRRLAAERVEVEHDLEELVRGRSPSEFHIRPLASSA